MILQICLGLLYFLIIFGIKDLTKVSVNYYTRFHLTSLYLAISTIPVLYYINSNLIRLRITEELFILVIGTVIIGVLVTFILKRLAKKDLHREDYLNRIDLRFITTKYFEILFQQAIVLLIIYTIYLSIQDRLRTVLLFLFIFTGLHFFNLFNNPARRALAFKISSFFGSMLFSWCILYFDQGYIYSFAIHVLFYLSIAIYSFFNPNNIFNIGDIQLRIWNK